MARKPKRLSLAIEDPHHQDSMKAVSLFSPVNTIRMRHDAPCTSSDKGCQLHNDVLPPEICTNVRTKIPLRAALPQLYFKCQSKPSQAGLADTARVPDWHNWIALRMYGDRSGQ